ncbi:MAG TPA: J domain-containing protein [Candidatus Limnocylindria bacterium]|nr:J domain-containing protein [Candidatus Limnocylindria bacterium]
MTTRPMPDAYRPMPDAYRVLQVDPSAHEVVIRAAYHALARRFHPDGETPDADHMAELNHAYDQLRDSLRRRAYDLERLTSAQGRNGGLRPVGPGTQDEVIVAQASAAPTAEVSPNAGPFSRIRPQAAAGANETWSRLDFGRYAGWSLRDLVRHDPDYLRWLTRHSSGLRYRAEIERLLPDGAGATHGVR